VNVLIVTLGSHGDVHPFLGIAAALRSRGHSVKIIASAYYDSLVRAMGLDFVPLGTPEDFENVARDPNIWRPFRGLRTIGKSIGESIQPCYQAVLDHALPGKTVLVYSTLAFGARLAQETLNLAGVSVHLSPVIFLSAYATPRLVGLRAPAWLPRPIKRAILDIGSRFFIDGTFGPPLNAYRATLGLPPVKRMMSTWCHSPQRVIGLFPDWYAAPQPDWPPQTVLTGFPLFDEKGVTAISPELEEFLSAGPPPIVFTPGSAMFHGQEFFSAGAEACRLLNRRGLLLTRHAEQIPRDLPPNVKHIPYAPFSQLLPRAAALVHHGGIGTTAQGLSRGVPQLLMPMGFDQLDNAERVARLGVAEQLSPRRFTAKNVAESLARLTDSPAVATACRAVTGKFTGDPLQQTAESIEELEP
jgi:rhamnosyltransferase subunit B